MKASAKVRWVEGNYVVGETASGVKVSMDSVPEGSTGKGPTPKELVLHALAGCTMLDVVPIILKSRKKLEKCIIEVEAETADEIPRVYKKIKLTYRFKSPDLDSKTAERAINLSHEKYCSVSKMLAKNVEISYEYEIEK